MNLPKRILIQDEDNHYVAQLSAALGKYDFQVKPVKDHLEAQQEILCGNCQFFVLNLFSGSQFDRDFAGNPVTKLLKFGLHEVKDEAIAPFLDSWLIVTSESKECPNPETFPPIFPELLKEKLAYKFKNDGVPDYEGLAKTIALRFEHDCPTAGEYQVKPMPEVGSEIANILTAEEMTELVRLSVRQLFGKDDKYKQILRVQLRALSDRGFDTTTAKTRAEIISRDQDKTRFLALLYKFAPRQATELEAQNYEMLSTSGLTPRVFATVFLRHGKGEKRVSASIVGYVPDSPQLGESWQNEVKNRATFDKVVGRSIDVVFRSLKGLWPSGHLKLEVPSLETTPPELGTVRPISELDAKAAIFRKTVVAHGDLHPGNVLIDKLRNDPVLIDYSDSSREKSIFHDYAVFEMHSALRLWHPKRQDEINAFVDWQITPLPDIPLKKAGWRWVAMGIWQIRQLVNTLVKERIDENAESTLGGRKHAEKVLMHSYLLTLLSQYGEARGKWLKSAEYENGDKTLVRMMAEQTETRLHEMLSAEGYL